MSQDAFEKDECYICRRPANLNGDGGIRRCECKRCGKYAYDRTRYDLHAANEDILVRLAGWVQGRNRFGIEPVIDLDDFRQIKTMKIPPIRERGLMLLRLLHDQMRSPGRYFSIGGVAEEDPDWLGVTYSKSDDDIELLLKVLADMYLLESSNGHWALTVAGMLKIEEGERAGEDVSQGFVAMSFSDELNSAWTDGFEPAIRDAGFAPMRIDGKKYLGGISDEIISEIRASRFVVVDYTEHKNGVYFEAGFALGLGLRVIPTVRQDEVMELHFDIRHLNTITWASPIDLRNKLSKRITAVIGRGPNSSQ